MIQKKFKIAFNAPVTLTFCAICLAAMVLNILTAGWSNRMLFSVYRSSLLQPLTYVRFIGHVFGHRGWSHFFGNIMYIMILGPMLEEKYGARTMTLLYLSTALVTGLLSFFFFPHTGMLGASGIVFALILLSSFTDTKGEGIPLTFILVACLYIGQQLFEMFSGQGNVAYIAHFGGGIVGAVLGFMLNKKRSRRF